MNATRADYCVVACADAFRGDGEIMASPMGLIPTLGARLARLTSEPDLVLTDGVATIRADTPPVSGETGEAVAEGWMPYRFVFDTLWWGRRHVMMGATQIDQYGNQNISCIGPWERPKVQLLGVRGAPGNTINHTTSYFVGRQNARVFVEKVDMVSGVGYDRAAGLSERQRRFHDIRWVITNLAVYDFDTPDRRMRVRSVHPGVEIEDVRAASSFELVIPDQVPQTRAPSATELELIRQLDPDGRRVQEVAE